MKADPFVVLPWLLALGAISPAVCRAQDESPSELLQKAIYTEETVGDLAAAIEMYRGIVAAVAADRDHAARAQLRLGLCYLKSGAREAGVAALRTLTTDYPEHDELVSRARARLAELGVALPDGGVVLRQVWPDAIDILGGPSPDGRSLSFVDWDTGDLAVYDFATGMSRNLTGKGSWESLELAEFSVFSPDGSRVAYAWWVEGDIYELRVVALDGSRPKVVHAAADTTWVRPMDWSPDDARILAQLYTKEGPGRLVTFAVADGEMRVLAELSESNDSKAVFSPDGRHVALCREQDDSAPPKLDIAVIDLEDGEERPLVEHPAADVVLGWSPDGKHLLFASDRSGGWGVWALPVAGGSAAGEAVLVQPGFEDPPARLQRASMSVPMGFSRDGGFFYAVRVSARDVHVVALDPETGRAAGRPALMDARFTSTASRPFWSPDGQQLAFVTTREGGRRLVIRHLGDDTVREVPLLPRANRMGGIDWSPDGASFAAICGGPLMDGGLFVVDAQTGEAELVYRNNGDRLQDPRWSRDGAKLYFRRQGRGLLAYDLESKKETSLWSGQVDAFALSPDGRSIALIWRDLNEPGAARPSRLVVLPAAGGASREIHSWVHFGNRPRLDWSPDGRHLFFGCPNSEVQEPPSRPPQRDLWRIAVAGGEPRLVLTAPGLNRFRIHPDGDRIALELLQAKADVWRMDNVLPR